MVAIKHTTIPTSNADKLRVAKEQYLRVLDYCQNKYRLTNVRAKWDGHGKTRLGYTLYGREPNVVQYIRFNMDFLNSTNSFLEIVNNTIPHELAHAVIHETHPFRSEGPHGACWKRVCIELGGNGQRCAHVPAPITTTTRQQQPRRMQRKKTAVPRRLNKIKSSTR